MDAASAKRVGSAQSFKNMLVESDPDLYEAYCTWIDTIILDKKDFLNRTILDTFIKTIREYTDSKQLQLKIIETAIISGWKNAAWACESVRKNSGGNGTRIGVTQKRKGEIDPNSGF